MEAPKSIAVAEARQRWRLVYARSDAAPRLAQRDQQAAWEVVLRATALPVVGHELEPPRPRIAFAAPLGVGLAAEHELADLFLTERLPVADVRNALRTNLPEGHRLVELQDIWLGAPALPGQVVAADYRASVRVEGEHRSNAPEVLAEAARRVLQEATLPRTRDKGGRDVAYDLRPLLGDIAVLGTAAPAPADSPSGDAAPADSPSGDAAPGDAGVSYGPFAPSDGLIGLRIRVLHDPERGVGRPEEVLAALGSVAGLELSFVGLVRERVVLAGDH